MQKLVLYGMALFPTVSNDNFASSNGNLIDSYYSAFWKGLKLKLSDLLCYILQFVTIWLFVHQSKEA